MNPQVRFTLTLNATWSVLRDPVLTKIYTLHFTRPCATLALPLRKGSGDSKAAAEARS